MKKIKQIAAICIVILLVGLYAATLIFAIIGSENTMGMFKASLYSTFVLPVLLWAYGLIYRLLKNRGEEIRKKSEEDLAEAEDGLAESTDGLAESTDGLAETKDDLAKEVDDSAEDSTNPNQQGHDA